MMSFFWGCFSLKASPVIDVSQKNSIQLSNVDFVFLIDSADYLINEVLELSSDFNKVVEIDAGVDDYVWGYCEIAEALNYGDNIWYFEFLDTKIDEVEFYVVNEKNEIFRNVSGSAKYNFNNRELPYHKSCFTVRLTTDDKTKVYFKIKRQAIVGFDIMLSSQKTFLKNTFVQYLINGVFIGALLIVFILVLGFVVFDWDISLLYFLFMLFGLILMFLTVDNLGFQYFWTAYPFVNEKGLELSLLVFILMQALFLRSFLDTSFMSAQFDNVLVGAMLVRVVIYSMGSFMDIELLSGLGVDTVTLSVFLLIAIKMRLKKHDLARFIVLALLVQIITCVLVTVNQEGILISEFMGNYGLQLGLTVAVVLSFVAIVDKIRYSNVFIVDENEEIVEE